MQQVQKVKDASNEILKLLVLFFCFSLILSSASAQNSFDFQRNFIRNLKYPESLRNTCTPTFANILIKISEKGSVENVLISDSAPKSFKDKFYEIKNKLNFSLLKPIVDSNKLKNCHIIIPVFYVYASDYCVNSFEPVGYIGDNYLVFEGKPLNSLTYNLKPIIISMYKPLH